MGLAIDEASKVEYYTLSFIALTQQCIASMLQGTNLLGVSFPLTLKFLSNLLLEDQGFESIVTLFLSSGKAESETGSVVFLLINEASKTTILAFVRFDFNLKLRSLLRKLFSKGLEFEEL